MSLPVSTDLVLLTDYSRLRLNSHSLGEQADCKEAKEAIRTAMGTRVSNQEAEATEATTTTSQARLHSIQTRWQCFISGWSLTGAGRAE